VTDHADLASRFGTPLYVYDLDRVDRARADLRGALPDGFDVFYAVKANPHPEVAGVLREGGCRAEISSTGELDTALAAGFAAAECLYTGPGKTDAELDAAIAAGVRLFSVESPSDLAHVGRTACRHGVVADCALRINGNTGTAGGIRMMGRPSQFGIDVETLPDVLPRLLAEPGTRVIGAHFFTMSNAADEAALIDELASVVELAAGLHRELGLPLEFLDIGGGFAAPYAAPGEHAAYPKLRAELERLLDPHLPTWRSGHLRLACESGRYLVADSGVLLCRVVNIKVSRGRRFVVVDAGINALGGLSGLGRLLPVAVRLDDPDGAETGSLVGPLCTPGDMLGRDIELPALEVGDVVTVPNVGAYGLTASLLAFLGRPAPTEVTVRGGEVCSASDLSLARVYRKTR
jgi:diaminopimelate decarboxylase